MSRLIFCLCSLLLGTAVAQAATFSIANGDVPALKNAIITANANGQADFINLAAGGTYADLYETQFRSISADRAPGSGPALEAF